MTDLRIGSLSVAGTVFLAPMSGITDQPFRDQVRRYGCALSYSEMIASRQMVRAHADTLRRAAHNDTTPLAIQLAGCEPAVMADAARVAADRGAALIDINMGCPAKKVIGGLAGSALMRDETQALRIIEAVVGAVEVPVTLKMRLGWDDASRNAPRLASLATAAGIRMITVHGRTRAQFYTGSADWDAIGAVKRSAGVPLIGNGDVTTCEHAVALLAASGADGVMIGRGACGRPWFPAQVAHFIATGRHLPDPPDAEKRTVMLAHYDGILAHYGSDQGVRIARKHLAWYAAAAVDAATAATFRAAVNQSSDPAAVTALIERLFDAPAGSLLAAA